jgi:hypothetical protein
VMETTLLLCVLSALCGDSSLRPLRLCGDHLQRHIPCRPKRLSAGNLPADVRNYRPTREPSTPALRTFG